MDELPIDASAVVPEMDELPIHGVPRPRARAET
jgi:hypothetical protein